MKKLLVLVTILFYFSIINGQISSDNESFISAEKGKGKFTISASGNSAPLLISSVDWPGVIRAFKDLQTDIGKVTSTLPEFCLDKTPLSDEIIIAGTIGKNPVIDEMVSNGKLDVKTVAGKWETFLIQVINKPQLDYP